MPRTALITGGSTGIGAAISTALLRSGFSIGIAFFENESTSTRKEAEHFSSSLSPSHPDQKVEILPVDLSDPISTVNLMEGFVRSFGRIDVLVNSACSVAGAGTPLLELGDSKQDATAKSDAREQGQGKAAVHPREQSKESLESSTKTLASILRSSFSVNFEAPLILSKRAAQYMIDQPPILSKSEESKLLEDSKSLGQEDFDLTYDLRSSRWGRGRLIHISSVHGTSCQPNSTPYVASKHALQGLSIQLAAELAGTSITSNTISPGMTCTAQTGLLGIDASEISRPAIPMGRPGRPEEVAAAVTYLTSVGAAYATGINLPVDGGFLLANPQYPGGRLNEGE